MMWFFAIMIVLALGGIALLAAGRGTPMAEVYDDRPDLGLPETGPVQGADGTARFRAQLRRGGAR